MDELPDTIYYPTAFDNSKAANFDGVFDWRWTQGCFGDTNITPMDFDGVVERNGHYLIFETKNPGKEVPRGQQWALERLREAKTFTIMIIWGKEKPEDFDVIYPSGRKKMYQGMDAAKERVSAWFQAADKDQLF